MKKVEVNPFAAIEFKLFLNKRKSGHALRYQKFKNPMKN